MERRDFKGAIASLQLDDTAAFADMKVAFQELQRRSSTAQTFTEFLAEDLLLKAAYTLMGRAKKCDDQDMPEAILDVVRTCEPFFQLMALPAGTSIFPKTIRDRVAASSVVLRCALGGADSPRHPKLAKPGPRMP